MVSQGDRLRFLKVCEAWHVCVDILFHDLLKCFEKFLYQFVCLVNLVSYIEFHVKGYLVVTASSCVKFLACITDSVDKVCFYKAVDIFVFGCDLEFAGSYICKDSVKTCFDLIFFFCCQDSLSGEHCYVCFAASDVLLIEFLVKRDGCVEVIYKFVCFFCETSAPKLCHCVIPRFFFIFGIIAFTC